MKKVLLLGVFLLGGCVSAPGEPPTGFDYFVADAAIFLGSNERHHHYRYSFGGREYGGRHNQQKGR